ncbi:MAG TPA: hypothetical protein VK422_08480 [Pyrinomonadaceae bacterium]|nr:hypothetical protein [Pyrinomonadaceae bacterium]
MSPQAKKYVRVRMYNVGFGDCFLLFIPSPDGVKKILFDCGVHFQGRGPRPIDEVAAQIVEDVRDPDGVARIDVVVGTHRHQDHVSGFESEVWDEVEVKEVWMPWTENPKDPEGRRILEKQSRRALQLQQAALRFGLGAKVEAMAVNSMTNEKAMLTLHEGFAGDPKRVFLPFKTRSANTFKRPFLPGVTVHVMGPSRDPQVIRDMDPPDEETFKHLSDLLSGNGGASELPFHSGWAVTPSRFGSAAKHLVLSKAETAKIEKFGEDDGVAAAVALEKAVNGTSLMLMLQVGKAYMLFPGDAQWGTWSSAMQDEEWRGLLDRTTFYKVGHHGSHNATPKSFVNEILKKDFWAMACTGPSHSWTNTIPQKDLLKALREKSKKVVRSDKADVPDPGSNFVREGNKYVEAKIPV